MDFENMQDLPLEEQIKVLNDIKANFEKEKDSLKQTVIILEDDKKHQEKVIIKSISSLEQKAKVSETISSIKSIKNALKGKDTELKLILSAIKNAEKLLEQKKKELAKKKGDEKKAKEDEEFLDIKKKYDDLLEQVRRFRQERENRKEIHKQEMSLNELLKNVQTNKLEEEIQQTDISPTARQKSQEFVYKTNEDVITDVKYSQQERDIKFDDYLGALEPTAMPGFKKVHQSEDTEAIRAIKYRINDVGFDHLTNTEKTQYQSWRGDMKEKKQKEFGFRNDQ